MRNLNTTCPGRDLVPRGLYIQQIRSKGALYTLEEHANITYIYDNIYNTFL